ncbi:MAG: hypothetical protein LCI00_20365 [Chloroflexi bacterium]|nr:hypothetical protein [Chloroflexota bacterium]MCC6893729.1 hypothetical protein [Anaerolineae bacterium]
MPLFVIFIFATIVFGAGAMLAPAWPTSQPRVGLMAALVLGVVMGGAVFWAMLFGWDTLVIDYLLFALMTSIFLFGTLSYGQKRAEARGETLADADQGWPGPKDLVFFGIVSLVFVIPVLLLPVPLDTDAQGFGYLSLMARLGGNFQTLAPWHPDITYLYSPGFSLLVAYLSKQLGQGIHTVQFSVGAVLSVLNIWLAYDMGSELRDKRLGRIMAIVMLLSIGLLTAFMDSHYTTLLGLVFAQAFLIMTLRFQRQFSIPDAVGAGLMLGALVLSHPDTTIIVMLGYVPWLVTMWFGKPRPTLRSWLVLAVGIPLLAVVAISPWLASISHLLGSDIASPFSRDPEYWKVLILYHGVWVIPIVIIGAVVGLRGRSQAAILAVGWLVFILEFSSLGILETLIPSLIEPVLRYDYPFSIAWHGPIIPYAILGGLGLFWLWERYLAPHLNQHIHRLSYGVMVAAAVVLVAVVALSPQLLGWSKGRVGFFGAFSSAADVRAMEWLKANTPADARVLNFPGAAFDNSHESDWVPVIAERDSIYYRWQPFFRSNEASLAEQDHLRAFWENPADPANAELLRSANVSYVIVPQLVTDPTSIATMFRWREPFTELVQMQSSVSDAPYLEQVFDSDGAQVYQLKP